MKIRVKIKPKELKEEIVPIRGEFIKLDSLLKFSMLAESGGDAKQMILDGEIKINGQICTQRGKKVRPGDVICRDNIVLKIVSEEESSDYDS